MEELAGKVGVEPTLAESESAVLPLDDFPSETDARANRACWYTQGDSNSCSRLERAVSWPARRWVQMTLCGGE